MKLNLNKFPTPIRNTKVNRQKNNTSVPIKHNVNESKYFFKKIFYLPMSGLQKNEGVKTSIKFAKKVNRFDLSWMDPLKNRFFLCKHFDYCSVHEVQKFLKQEKSIKLVTFHNTFRFCRSSCSPANFELVIYVQRRNQAEMGETNINKSVQEFQIEGKWILKRCKICKRISLYFHVKTKMDKQYA